MCKIVFFNLYAHVHPRVTDQLKRWLVELNYCVLLEGLVPWPKLKDLLFLGLRICSLLFRCMFCCGTRSSFFAIWTKGGWTKPSQPIRFKYLSSIKIKRFVLGGMAQRDLAWSKLQARQVICNSGQREGNYIMVSKLKWASMFYHSPDAPEQGLSERGLTGV